MGVATDFFGVLKRDFLDLGVSMYLIYEDLALIGKKTEELPGFSS